MNKITAFVIAAVFVLFVSSTAWITHEMKDRSAQLAAVAAAEQTPEGMPQPQIDKYAQIDGYDASGIANAVNQKIKDTGSADVIITLKLPFERFFDSSDTAAARANKKAQFDAAKNAVAAAAGQGKGIKEDLQIINGISLTVNQNALKGLARNPNIEKIDLDTVAYIVLDTSPAYINAPSAWIKTDDKGSVLTGIGMRIAIIDTGVDYTKSDLGGCFGKGCKVEGGWDFVNKDGDPMDDQGHGTHVAATAAGIGVVGTTSLKGVAPGANILAYKVCEPVFGICYASGIIAAINRAVDPNKDGNSVDHADVISMSLGGTCYTYSTSCGPDDTTSVAVNNAAAAGVVSAIAAGNKGSSLSTVNSPGTAATAVTVAAACAPHGSLSTSYCGTTGTNPIASFSSRGPVVYNGTDYQKPDITAPGVMICAARWKTAFSTGPTCFDTSHVRISGTSMAAPHIAGALAILKQAHPTYTPEQLKKLLKASATDLGSGMTYNDQGAGIVNMKKAIACGILATGASLTPGQSITSCNSLFTLTFQTDSDVVLYDNATGIALWSTKTAGKAATRLMMQFNCNLVLSDAKGSVLWSSVLSGGLSGFRMCTLGVKDDGNLIIRAGVGTIMWNSNTASSTHTATLTQSAYQTAVGQSFDITWSSTNATSCSLEKKNPDGTITSPWATGTSSTKATAPNEIGEHHWSIDCTGVNGTAHADLEHIVVAAPDNTPPSVSITAPIAGSTVSGNITITASSSDNVGIKKVEFYDDWSQNYPFTTDTASPYTYSYDTYRLANGTHTFWAKAYDAADNVASSALISVTVNNILRTATFTINGSRDVTLKVGDPLAYAWSSTGGVWAKTTLRYYDGFGKGLPSSPGTYTWMGEDGVALGVTASGTPPASAGTPNFIQQANEAGRSVTFLYDVYDSAGKIVASTFAKKHVSSPVVADSRPRGYVSANCSTIYGWAQDQDIPDSAIGVHIYIDSGFAGRPVANLYRSDLCTSIGSCDHSFSFTTPATFKDGKTHTVYAYGIDQDGIGTHNMLLIPYPGPTTTFMCSSSTTSTASLSASAISTSDTTSSSLGIDSRVITSSKLNVRSKADTTLGKILCTQASGAEGTITAGPSSAQSSSWWSVNFDKSCDGWVVQDYLSSI